ncbi:hypothetical protein [Bacillus sp. Hm123]|uniref:hypothetical protein n=1 Tax=Bacillus sp. Hm123 TaxID=3450745 RepID=UPI003F422A11
MIVINFLTSFIASALVMKGNIDWHKRILYLSIPLFVLFMLGQAMYIIYCLKEDKPL